MIVENLNVVKRHSARARSRTVAHGRPQVSPAGSSRSRRRCAVSNVMVVCPVCKRPTRVGIKVKEIKGETVRVRVCKRDGCGQEIDR